eukprot:g16233.t1
MMMTAALQQAYSSALATFGSASERLIPWLVLSEALADGGRVALEPGNLMQAPVAWTAEDCLPPIDEGGRLMSTYTKQLVPTCDTAVVIGFTRAWTAPAAVVLQALCDVEPQPFDAIMMVQDVPQAQRDLLNSIRPCQFIDYDIDLQDPDRFARVSTMAFSRYECWAMLEQYQHVLWIDADTLPVGEILSCFDHVKDTGLGLIPHTGTPIRVSFAKDVPGFEMQREP